MEEKKVSVIIPLYNRKHLIERCVRSVQNQTYRHLEMIIVDDGSTDEPDEVLAALAQDERVRVIRKPNGGVSSARNAGLDAATGEYVQFLDSDDVLVSNATEIAVSSMERHAADVVSFGVLHEKSDCCLPPAPIGEHRLFYGEDIVLASFREYRQCTVWNKLYRRCLIGRLRFPEGVSWGEDYIFSLAYLSVSQRMVSLDAKLILNTADDELSLNRRYDPKGFHDVCLQYKASLVYLAAHPSQETEYEIQRYLWGCYAQCFRKLCLRSRLSHGECVNILRHWSESGYVRWLRDECCPKAADCRCARRKLFFWLPFVIKWQNIRKRIFP